MRRCILRLYDIPMFRLYRNIISININICNETLAVISAVISAGYFSVIINMDSKDIFALMYKRCDV